jgi:hypothetical protein
LSNSTPCVTNLQLSLSLQEYLFIVWRRRDGPQSVTAKRFGVSPAFLSGVLNGNKNPSKAMLEDVGLMRTIVKTAEYKPSWPAVTQEQLRIIDKSRPAWETAEPMCEFETLTGTCVCGAKTPDKCRREAMTKAKP